MVAPVAVAPPTVLVVTVAVDRRVARDRRLHEGRPAIGTQLPVFFDEHVHGQDTHHLGQHKGQCSKIKRPAVGVALLVVTLTRVIRVS